MAAASMWASATARAECDTERCARARATHEAAGGCRSCRPRSPTRSAHPPASSAAPRGTRGSIPLLACCTRAPRHVERSAVRLHGARCLPLAAGKRHARREGQCECAHRDQGARVARGDEDHREVVALVHQAVARRVPRKAGVAAKTRLRRGSIGRPRCAGTRSDAAGTRSAGARAHMWARCRSPPARRPSGAPPPPHRGWPCAPAHARRGASGARARAPREERCRQHERCGVARPLRQQSAQRRRVAGVPHGARDRARRCGAEVSRASS